MRKTITNRRELLDVLLGRHRSDLQNSLSLEPVGEAGHEMSVIWREDIPESESLPSIITMPREAHREFLAWAYTYLAVLRPFTAFIRLLDPATTTELLRRTDVQDLGRFREAFVALIIAESASYLDVRSDFFQQLTPSACANSHSYALAKALALGFGEPTEEVSSAWCSVRDLTKQRSPFHNVRDLKTVFEVLTGCRDSQSAPSASIPQELPLFQRACREIAEAGDVKDETWSDLIGSWVGLFGIRRQMVESRENRVRAFDKAWTTIAEIAGANPTLASFISGYLASRIAPGEMDHISVVAKTLRSAPSALLWFGVCSGLRSEGQILTIAGGLGRRILRDLEQTECALDRPRCDMAVGELEVLFNQEKPLTDFRTGSNGLLSVELVPSVTTTVRWPRPSDRQSDPFERRDLSFRALGLFKDLSVALDHVDYLRRRLEREVDLGVEPQRGTAIQKPKKR